ncbi:MAG: hypothetical protein ACP5HU_05195 [Phycisphaerae bacterium]
MTDRCSGDVPLKGDIRRKHLRRQCGPAGRRLAMLAAILCILSASHRCPGVVDRWVATNVAFKVADTRTGPASRPRAEVILRWLDRQNYTADELLLFKKLPIVVSGGWQRPIWWRTYPGFTPRRGKGLALPKLSVRCNSIGVTVTVGLKECPARRGAAHMPARSRPRAPCA